MRSVSYVVVTMNRCAEVVRCLRSLQAHTYPDTEIIVVDNQSSDGTARVVAEQFPEARLLISTENLGAAGGRNLGIEAARGDICVFIDADAELRDAEGRLGWYRILRATRAWPASLYASAIQTPGKTM